MPYLNRSNWTLTTYLESVSIVIEINFRPNVLKIVLDSHSIILWIFPPKIIIAIYQVEVIFLKKLCKFKWALIMRPRESYYFICVLSFFRPTPIIAFHIFGGKNHHPLLWESSTIFRTLAKIKLSYWSVTDSNIGVLT